MQGIVCRNRGRKIVRYSILIMRATERRWRTSYLQEKGWRSSRRRRTHWRSETDFKVFKSNLRLGKAIRLRVEDVNADEFEK